MPSYLPPPPANPLARLLAGLLAVAALAGAIFVGLFAAALVVGLGLIAWTAIWLRLWWLRRRLMRDGGPARPGPGEGPQGREVIDAEYTVVSRREDQ